MLDHFSHRKFSAHPTKRILLKNKPPSAPKTTRVINEQVTGSQKTLSFGKKISDDDKEELLKQMTKISSEIEQRYIQNMSRPLNEHNDICLETHEMQILFETFQNLQSLYYGQ